MKILKIETRIAEGKILTALKTEGYNKTDVSHQLEIIGLIDNAKAIVQERIKRLAHYDK